MAGFSMSTPKLVINCTIFYTTENDDNGAPVWEYFFPFNSVGTVEELFDAVESHSYQMPAIFNSSLVSKLKDLITGDGDKTEFVNDKYRWIVKVSKS